MEEIKFKKALGQNFIFDKNLLGAIATDGEVSPSDVVLEIGAGAGTLTEILCDRAKEVVSFEIDLSLADRLNEIEARHDNLKIIFEDFLNFDISKLDPFPTRVVANIPYYITTPIIFKLCEYSFKSILVLVQKEVAERFASRPKTKEYGITSVILQSKYSVSIPRVVKKENFIPSPKVDSATVKFVPNNKFQFKDFSAFRNFVHLCFSMRRKTLVNNLKGAFDKERVLALLGEMKKSSSVRPEELSVEEFVFLFNKLYD